MDNDLPCVEKGKQLENSIAFMQLLL